MPVRRFADFFSELQQLERASIAAQGPLILDAFARHTRFDGGALYLRDGRNSGLRLAAKATRSVAPEILDVDVRAEDAVQPAPVVVVALQSQREMVGVLALSTDTIDELMDDDVAFVRAAAAYVSTLLTNQRLTQDMREGDFQLKYRLWELESLYDIGLSIASTLNVDEL
ncbi:MAG TPA: GAF domain-containing protein, partial [Thermoanaerobaculia bacterium]